MKTTPRTAFLVCLAAASTLAGCTDEPEVVDPRLAQATAELVRAQSCEDLEHLLREDAMARIDRQMDAFLLLAEQFDDSSDVNFFGGGSRDEGGNASGEELDGGSDGAGTGSGDMVSGGGDEDLGGGAPPPDHSNTNNQVEGVDEADIVKTDGERLYVLSGTSFTVLQAWPASALAVEQSIGLTGQPIEMFVEGGKAVIFAHADGAAVYAAAGVEPEPAYQGPGGGMDGDCFDCGGSWNPMTQVVVLDLTQGVPTVEREWFFEGSYLSSRRIGDQVRVVLSGGAHFPGTDVWPECFDGCDSSEDWIEAVEDARARAKERIRRTTLEQYVPYRFGKQAEGVSALDPACADYWVPTSGTSEYGLTQIEQIDLSNPGAEPTRTAIVGSAQTVYSNESTMVLAGMGYDVSRYIGSVPTSIAVALNSSFLHTFDLAADPARPTYSGSTRVPGHLIDQFAIDERDGVLRVATHVYTQDGEQWSETNALYTVDKASASVLGGVEGLAEGEQMYSARFVGDRGYFVTFLQTDPLFVFDVADPSNPVLKGELHIPGFSEYMHPIDGGDHLLTIGQDGTLDGTNGMIALQIFDVRDATNPVLRHKLPLQGWSDALYDHKAFTFWREMLAIPYQGYDEYGSYSTQLALFSVDVEDGIQERGRIDHTAFYDLGDEHAYCFPGGVRRGVFIEDFLYSVSDGGVAVHESSTLEPVAAVTLPSFDVNAACGGY